MDRRHEHRLTTVVAGPGFGKTSALVEALARPIEGTHDVWLRCEPADQDGMHFAAALASVMDSKVGPSNDATLTGALDAVWARAPAQLCVVLDDVHQLGDATSGASVLRRFADEMAGNGHLVTSSRHDVPVAMGRLAATGELLRVSESDLRLDDSELRTLEAMCGLRSGTLDSTGGWPALVAITIAGPEAADLLPQFVWEEVLGELEPDRVRELAAFAVVGGGDDSIASAVAGRHAEVRELIGTLPLVEVDADGRAIPHALWLPLLRPMLDPDDADRARRAAAQVHRDAGSHAQGIELLLEAEAWDDATTAIARAESACLSTASPMWRDSAGIPPSEFGRWWSALPASHRGTPGARLAKGIELQALDPAAAVAHLEAAAVGFRSIGDRTGEVASLGRLGVIHWWSNDVPRLFALYEQLQPLIDAGDPTARWVGVVGTAGIHHLAGDSEAVLTTVAEADEELGHEWGDIVRWLRSVAHRRNGDLSAARRALVDPGRPGALAPDSQLEIARLRADWLDGDVDVVLQRLVELHIDFVRSGQSYLAAELGYEAAARAGHLGDTTHAMELLQRADEVTPHLDSTLLSVLRTLALASIALARGDEGAATGELAPALLAGPTAISAPEGWYWRDRGAISLTYILVEGSRPHWDAATLRGPHALGRRLGRTIAAARSGDLTDARTLVWPSSQQLRTHLPVRLLAELVATTHAAHNPPPTGTLDSLPSAALGHLRDVAGARLPVSSSAAELVRRIPIPPKYRMRLSVLGPLVLERDDRGVDHPDLGRRRVRELLTFLAVHVQVRREAVADELWGDAANPSHNLRVTLNYLQKILQPDRPDRALPYLLRVDGSWLQLAVGDHLDVDVVSFARWCDDFDDADRAGNVPAMLDLADKIVDLWRGEPLADAPYADWAVVKRVAITTRFVRVARRAGELWLAGGRLDRARLAAERIVAYDPTDEHGWQLGVRVDIAAGDRWSALRRLDQLDEMLADLGLSPTRESQLLRLRCAAM